MTITQRLEQEIAPIRPAYELSVLAMEAMRSFGRAVSALWLEIRQWG